MKKKKSGNKSLFDHITHITQHQTKGYWDSLNETEKKQWSNYMINRFLSMKMEWTDFVNEIQKLKLDPRQLYVVYSSMELMIYIKVMISLIGSLLYLYSGKLYLTSIGLYSLN